MSVFPVVLLLAGWFVPSAFTRLTLLSVGVGEGAHAA